jgi:hypothetical protein
MKHLFLVEQSDVVKQFEHFKSIMIPYMTIYFIVMIVTIIIAIPRYRKTVRLLKEKKQGLPNQPT